MKNRISKKFNYVWYLSGITFVIVGIIPIAFNVFQINLLGNNPLFFILGGLWLSLIFVWRLSKREISNI